MTSVLHRLLSHARYEVLPTPKIEGTIAEYVPAGRTITVTASPARGLGATVDLAIRLAASGYDVVPHLAARMVRSAAELSEITDRLTQSGISKVFVPAGDAAVPAGPYPSALELLEGLVALGDPFRHVGITGYPESHPIIVDDVLVQAMWDKRHHATEIVSNLTFDPKTLTRWLRRVRARGVTAPVLIGLPGPVERAKLLNVAAKIGVRESTRFLAKNKRGFARIAAPGGYDPLRFLTGAQRVLGEEAMRVEGLHIFTFNQVAETEAWLRTQIERLGESEP